MKSRKNYTTLFLALFFGSIFFQSCTKDKCSESVTYVIAEPIYLSYEDLRVGVASETPRDLKNPGKIYLIGNYLLVNEQREGIHVIDNTDPSNPINTGFIKIPGNVDMAVRNNTLYADSYVDLVVLDISDIKNPVEVKRFEDSFPANSQMGLYAYEEGIITGWEEVERTDEYDCRDTYGYPYPYAMFDINTFSGGPVMTLESSTNLPVSNTAIVGTTGIGGSMARFTIVANYLYTIENSGVDIYNISSPNNPSEAGNMEVIWGIETLFPMGGMLFIGSQSGMFVYDVSNPAAPTYVSEFQHARACDPVVVEGNYAYVTLRGGTPCGGFENQLDVIDISNISNPELVRTYAMDEPYGLGIDDGTLFICDGNSGLKVYDANDVEAIDQNQLAHYTNINAFDVIPINDVLLMIGADGLYQYDYSNLNDINLLSTIAVVR